MSGVVCIMSRAERCGEAYLPRPVIKFAPSYSLVLRVVHLEATWPRLLRDGSPHPSDCPSPLHPALSLQREQRWDHRSWRGLHQHYISIIKECQETSKDKNETLCLVEPLRRKYSSAETYEFCREFLFVILHPSRKEFQSVRSFSCSNRLEWSLLYFYFEQVC